MNGFFDTVSGQIIIQLIGFVAMAIAILSFQARRRCNIMIMQAIGNLIWVVQFFLLGSSAGALLNLISAVRNLLYSQKDRLALIRSPIVPATFIVIFAASGFLTYGIEGPLAFLPAIASVIASIAFYITDETKVRYLSLLIAPSWLIYDVISFSIAGIISELCSTTSIIIALVRYHSGKSIKNKSTIAYADEGTPNCNMQNK